MTTFSNRSNPECVITREIAAELSEIWLCVNGEELNKEEWQRQNLLPLPVRSLPRRNRAREVREIQRWDKLREFRLLK